MSKNLRAFCIGVAIIATLSAAGMALLYFDHLSAAGLFEWGSLAVAGFATAALASARKLLLAALLAFPAVLLFSLELWLWQLAGRPADRYGVALVLIELVFSAFMCASGGAIGWLVTRHSPHSEPLPATRP